MNREPGVIIGCGILEKEIRCIIKKNGWHHSPRWIDAGFQVLNLKQGMIVFCILMISEIFAAVVSNAETTLGKQKQSP